MGCGQRVNILSSINDMVIAHMNERTKETIRQQERENHSQFIIGLLFFVLP